MNATQDSVEELRRRSDQTRAELTATIQGLKNKVGDTASDLKAAISPANIKHEIKTYVRDQGESIVQSAQRKIQDNPLQALAIGAAVAYPAWGLLRAIPAPLLMIGAGLWLTSSRGKQAMVDVSATVSDAVDRGTTAAGEYAGRLQSEVTDQIQAAGKTLSGLADDAASRATALTDQVRGKAHDLRDAVSAGSDAVLGSIKTATAEVTGNAGDTLADAGRTLARAQHNVAQTAKDTQSFAMDMIENNPLLVAGIGIAIGAFIAGALPKSDIEDRVLGQPSDDLKSKARDAASAGFDQAKDLASGVASDVAAAFSKEGLDVSGIKDTVATAAQGVKSLVDRSVDTALGAERSQTRTN